MSLKWIIYLALIYCGIIVIKNHPVSLLILLSCFILYKILGKRKTPHFKSLEKQLMLLRQSIDSFNAVILNAKSTKSIEPSLLHAFTDSTRINLKNQLSTSDNIWIEPSKTKSYKLYSYLERLNHSDLFFQ